jgi:hypothetical protein
VEELFIISTSCPSRQPTMERISTKSEKQNYQINKVVARRTTEKREDKFFSGRNIPFRLIKMHLTAI